jgi:hypothetical protein
MTDTMTSQNIDLSSWDTLCICSLEELCFVVHNIKDSHCRYAFNSRFRINI